MSGRTPVHRLNGGLYVSGLPDPPKERPSTGPPRPVPYTGGDVLQSGELGKMFDLPISVPSTPPSSRPRTPSSTPSRNHSGLIPPTGLITSTSVRPSKPPSDGATTLPPTTHYTFRIPTLLICVCMVTFGLGLGAGAFVLAVVRQPIILISVAGVVLIFGTMAVWNRVRGGGEVERVLRRYHDTEIDVKNLPIGKLIKVTGVVTCGAIPLETSYRLIERCVYTAVELYEYRGWSGAPANANHRRFTWGLRHSKRFVADFYISDKNSRTRFLVRAGNGNKVVSFVKSSKVLDTSNNKDLSPNFQRWLCDNKLSNEDRLMRLEEGLIQEGTTVSVMGILRKCDNTLIIDPPMMPFSTGWQWSRCQFPMYVDGLILLGDKSTAGTVYHV